MYAARWRLLLALALLLFVPIGLVDASSEWLAELKVERLDAFAVALFAAALTQFFLAEAGDLFYAGVVAAVVSEARTGRRHGRLLHVARTLPYGTLIAADLIVAFGTAIGIVLFVVPGLVFYTWFALTAPVIEIERLGLRAAFRRSRQLVRGNFWRVLLLLGTLEVAAYILITVMQGGAVWGLGDSFAGDFAASVVVNLLLTPVTAIVAVVLTFELIALKRRGLE